MSCFLPVEPCLLLQLPFESLTPRGAGAPAERPTSLRSKDSKEGWTVGCSIGVAAVDVEAEADDAA